MAGRDRTRARLRRELAELGVEAPERTSARELLAMLDEARADQGLPPARRSGLVGVSDRPVTPPHLPQEAAEAPATGHAFPIQPEPPEAPIRVETRLDAAARWVEDRPAQPVSYEAQRLRPRLGPSTAEIMVAQEGFTRHREGRPRHAPADGPGSARRDVTLLGARPDDRSHYW